MQNETTGEGIKRTPAYDTPYSEEKLQQWRSEFWGKYFSHQLTPLFVIRNKNVRLETCLDFD